MFVPLAVREPALSLIPGVIPTFGSSPSRVSPERLVAVGSTSDTGVELLAALVGSSKASSSSARRARREYLEVTGKEGSSSVPDATVSTDRFEVDLGTGSSPLRARSENVPLSGIEATASDQPGASRLRTDDGCSRREEPQSVVETLGWSETVQGIGSAVHSQSTADRLAALPGEGDAAIDTDSLGDLICIVATGPAMLTSRIAAFGVCVGLCLVWYYSRSTGSMAPKARSDIAGNRDPGDRDAVVLA